MEFLKCLILKVQSMSRSLFFEKCGIFDRHDNVLSMTDNAIFLASTDS